MTTAFIDAIDATGGQHTYPSLMADMNRILVNKGFDQRPQLSASQATCCIRLVLCDFFSLRCLSVQAFNSDRPFSLTDIVSNQNPVIGRQFNRRHSPRRDYGDTGFGTMLACCAVVMLAGGLLMHSFDAQK